MSDAPVPSGAKHRNRYAAIIEDIFRARHEHVQETVQFDRDDIAAAVRKLDIQLPKNLGDLIYSFRYRTPLPESILATAPKGRMWIIRPVGRSRYRFALVSDVPIAPNRSLAATKIPDATPGMIAKYAFGNEQGVLARIIANGCQQTRWWTTLDA